jgi:hypothetical protein
VLQLRDVGGAADVLEDRLRALLGTHGYSSGCGGTRASLRSAARPSVAVPAPSGTVIGAPEERQEASGHKKRTRRRCLRVSSDPACTTSHMSGSDANTGVGGASKTGQRAPTSPLLNRLTGQIWSPLHGDVHQPEDLVTSSCSDNRPEDPLSPLP